MSPVRSIRFSLYVLNFLFFAQWAMASYFNAAFLSSRGIPDAYIGLVFAGSSALGALLLLIAPDLLRDSGNYRLFMHYAFLLGLLSTMIAFTTATAWVTVLFMVIMAVFFLLSYSLDMFLEAATPMEHTTGLVRALFLTMANSAIAIAPLIGGFLLQEEKFEYLYLTMAVLAIPILFVAHLALKRFETPFTIGVRWRDVLRALSTQKFRNILIAQFLLRMFFAVMVIYTPIYLHENIGFAFSELGFMFFIMLLPFIFIEIPLGRLADKRWGEKEMLLLGFVLLVITTATLSFITTASIAIWTAALFATRIGAAFIDIMSESYFFKQVSGKHLNMVSFFRILYPLAYIVAPILASVFLLFYPLQFLFVALAAVMAVGIPAALALRDTR